MKNTPKIKDKWVSGIKQAADLLGVEPAVLKVAKRHPAFEDCFKENGRCNVDQLRERIPQYQKELEESQPEDGAYWKSIKQKYDALISEKTYEELQKKYLPKEEVEKHIQAIAQAQKALLRTVLVQELPPQIMGATVPEIAAKMETVVNQVCELMQGVKV